MYRIDGTNVATALPTPGSPGTQGYFKVTGDPAAATYVTGDWCNAVQEELVALATLTGAALSKAAVSQAAAAVKALASATPQTVSSNVTLTASQAGLVEIDASGGSRAIVLPAANALGGLVSTWRLVRTDSSGNAVTVAVPAGHTYGPGGGTSAITLAAYDVLTLISNGNATWYPVWGRRAAAKAVWSAAGSYSWTPPAGVWRVRATVVGGGGAGGSTPATSSTQCAVAPGGNGGTIAAGDLAVVPGVPVTVVVGAGGAPAAAPSAGASGGTSSVGSLSAPGGAAGLSPGLTTSGQVQTPPLASAVATGGASNSREFSAHPGIAASLVNMVGGRGGEPLGGGGAGNVTPTTGGVGSAGNAPGAGGGGAAAGPSQSGYLGGAGADGMVLLEW